MWLGPLVSGYRAGIQVLDVFTSKGLSVLRMTLKYCYYHDLWLNT